MLITALSCFTGKAFYGPRYQPPAQYALSVVNRQTTHSQRVQFWPARVPISRVNSQRRTLERAFAREIFEKKLNVHGNR